MEEVKKNLVIGIDPGVNTGWAIYGRGTKSILEIRTLNFWTCMDQFLNKTYSPNEAIVVIETPLEAVMYQQYESVQAKGSQRRGNRMMSNVASNATEARLLAEGIERLGFEVRRVKPTRRNFDKASDDAAYVKRVTGYAGPSNPHTRDAIMLCYGI